MPESYINLKTKFYYIIVGFGGVKLALACLCDDFIAAISFAGGGTKGRLPSGKTIFPGIIFNDTLRENLLFCLIVNL